MEAEMSYQELLENLERRIKAVDPSYEFEKGVFNHAGEIIFRITLPGVKIIESTNVKALSVIVENLEMQKEAQRRASQIR